MYHLFLDDERLPGNVTWVSLPAAIYEVVRDFDEFVSIITQHGVPKFVTFDHDLADYHYKVMQEELDAMSKPSGLILPDSFTTFVEDEEGGMNVKFDYGPEKTGYDCAKWLVDFCIDNDKKFPSYAVHSMNPIGKARIIHYIENAKKHTGI